ncbi:hypothetical protein [Enhydrobacter sp.]|jgi:hypothetical protein|nr:hypothetical protein [Enhydrobacter sp.]WIM09336.1 MAG: hypothetical protein OJF58_000287 [Enhydrobacter sp.]
MPTAFLVRLRRLLADTRDRSLVHYSSLGLLVTIAALAVCAHLPLQP